ncbi:MAG: FeoB-associated Cys-rich membrane protein [Clostridiales Family XIII bacterium]|nr:FeoB-associated Cys-rich membrane protein [Clostridiales Family XIII bacterium]
MIEFLTENAGTILVAAALAAIVTAIAVSVARRVRRGGCVSGCACCDEKGNCMTGECRERK